jgi:hypothetical protein
MFSCSLAALVALICGACGNSNPAPVRGSVSASWSIIAAGDNATCARVGAASVSLTLHNHTSNVDITTALPCADTTGTTAVPAGDYDATLALRTANGTALATAPIQGMVTVAPGQIAVLQPATFSVVDRGALVLSLAAVATRANCNSHEQGGADVTGIRIDFEHAANGCAPVTFARMREGATVGTYTVDCGSPAVISCLERDETLVASGIESGPYAIRVLGLRSTVVCWLGTDVLSLPGSGATLTKRVQVAPLRSPGC